MQGRNEVSESAEEEARRLLVELRILEGTADSLRQRIAFLTAALSELNLARMALEGIEKEEADASLFVPIGGGSFIKAKLADKDKVIYGVGAGVSIEKTVKEAEEGVANRLSELGKTRLALEQQFDQVLRKIQEDQTRFQELTAQYRERERR